MCPDISPAQFQINSARQKAARQTAIDNHQRLVTDLQTRIGNCERRQNDPLKSVQLPGLRHQLSLAQGALDAAIARDEQLTNGVTPGPAPAPKDWLSQSPGTAEVIAEREAKRGRGRPRKIAP